MRTDAAVEAIDDFNERAYELYNQYDGDVPVYEIEEIYASVDTGVTSSLSEELMNRILEVFGAE